MQHIGKGKAHIKYIKSVVIITWRCPTVPQCQFFCRVGNETQNSALTFEPKSLSRLQSFDRTASICDFYQTVLLNDTLAPLLKFPLSNIPAVIPCAWTIKTLYFHVYYKAFVAHIGECTKLEPRFKVWHHYRQSTEAVLLPTSNWSWMFWAELYIKKKTLHKTQLTSSAIPQKKWILQSHAFFFFLQDKW